MKNTFNKIFKLFVLILCLTSCIFCFACADNNSVDADALIRIHIRANSNGADDQNVKLKVRDKINEVMEGELKDVKTFDEAYKIICDLKPKLIEKAVNVLTNEGFSYSADVKVTNEFFPTRMYGGVTVESGFYDAVIVELGEAKGDNWWCVIYPPLCYVEAEGVGEVKYKSKIKELWDKFFS